MFSTVRNLIEGATRPIRMLSVADGSFQVVCLESVLSSPPLTRLQFCAWSRSGHPETSFDLMGEHTNKQIS